VPCVYLKARTWLRKSSKIALIIGCAAILAGAGMGYLFRDKLFHPVVSSVVPQQPNWFVAIPFMLILVGFVVMGYLTEWRIRK
jgi:hypothetical protein